MGLQVAGSQNATFPYRLALAGRDVGRVLGPVALVVYLGFFVLLGKSNSGPDVYDHTVLTQTMFALPMLGYLGWLVSSRRLPGRTPLDWGIFALIVAYALAIATSVNPRVSLEASLFVAAAILAFYAVHDVRALPINLWVSILLAVGALISLVALLSILLQYVSWLQQVSAVKGDLTLSDLLPPSVFRTQLGRIHPSPLAMFLNLCLPFAAARVFASRGSERAISVAVLTVIVLALFFTLTRGAWLGTMAGAAVFGALLLADRAGGLSLSRIGARLFRGIPGRVLGATVVIGALALVLFAIQIQPDWLFRATLDDRLEAGRTAIAIFADHWLTGAGPYTFLLLDDLYTTQRDAGVVVIVHPHNIYLQVLTELGIVGAAAIAICAVLLVQALRAAWSATRGQERLYVAAGGVALLAAAVHGLFDAPASWNTIFVPMAVVLAITLRLAPLPAVPALFRRVPRTGAILLLPVVLVSWVALDIGHSHFDRSLQALENGRLDVAASEAIKAADADEGLYAYALHAGVTLVQQYQEDPGKDTYLEDGISYLERAIELDPHSALGYANLALARQLQGDREAAVAAARSAIADSPGDSDILTAAGSVFEWAGLEEEAVSAYGGALSLDPNLTQAAFWSTTSERLDLRAEAIARSELNACSAGRPAALYGVYTADLPALASDCAALVEQGGSAPDRASLALMLFALGSTAEAREQAGLARAAAPSNKDVLLSSAVVLSDDIADVRHGLLKARAQGNQDAGPLLSATYVPDAGIDSGLSLLLPSQAEDIPASIGRLLPAWKESQRTGGTEASRRTSIYYSWGALREAPPITLISGDWALMASPCALVPWDISRGEPVTSSERSASPTCRNTYP